MTTEAKPSPLHRAAAIASAAETFRHPWNERSELSGTALGPLAGLERTGVTLARLPPGKESFVYHRHHTEEEWIYILEGRGIAEIGAEEHEVGPGDFMGFAAPSVAHHLRNPFDRDLVYLMGGERRRTEIADYPRLGKRMVRDGDRMAVYALAAGAPFPWPGAEEL
jgi:uncharacterized cupin superfamily protein